MMREIMLIAIIITEIVIISAISINEKLLEYVLGSLHAF